MFWRWSRLESMVSKCSLSSFLGRQKGTSWGGGGGGQSTPRTLWALPANTTSLFFLLRDLLGVGGWDESIPLRSCPSSSSCHQLPLRWLRRCDPHARFTSAASGSLDPHARGHSAQPLCSGSPSQEPAEPQGGAGGGEGRLARGDATLTPLLGVCLSHSGAEGLLTLDSMSVCEQTMPGAKKSLGPAPHFPRDMERPAGPLTAA